MNDSNITLHINDQYHELRIANKKTLLEVLRDDLKLKGAKCGCGMGECGTCTVLLDGQPVLSCLILAVTVQDHAITTIEGLKAEVRPQSIPQQDAGHAVNATKAVSSNQELHPLQEAFVDYGAIQCGFCTPGMILTAKALLDHNPSPGDAEIREAIAGNLCRCTSYVKIVEAIKSCSRKGQGLGRG